MYNVEVHIAVSECKQDLAIYAIKKNGRSNTDNKPHVYLNDCLVCQIVLLPSKCCIWPNPVNFDVFID